MFTDLTGDRNLLYFNPVFTNEKTKFKEPVVHGMWATSFLSTLIGMTLPGKGSIIKSLLFDFKKPVYVNDTIELNIEVTKKFP
jgi:acyl dehydratase